MGHENGEDGSGGRDVLARVAEASSALPTSAADVGKAAAGQGWGEKSVRAGDAKTLPDRAGPERRAVGDGWSGGRRQALQEADEGGLRKALADLIEEKEGEKKEAEKRGFATEAEKEEEERKEVEENAQEEAEKVCVCVCVGCFLLHLEHTYILHTYIHTYIHYIHTYIHYIHYITYIHTYIQYNTYIHT